MNWLNSLAIMGLLFTAVENLPEIKLSFLDTNTQTAANTSGPNENTVTDKVTGTYKFTPEGRVSVSNVNGNVTVTGWDKNEIEMEVVKFAATKELLDTLEVKINNTADNFELEIKYPRNNARNSRTSQTNSLRADIKLKVPAGINLNGIELVNGNVNVSGLTNNARVSLVNGAMTATNMGGSSEFSTVSGSINADYRSINPGSKIELGTVSGHVILKTPSNLNAIITAETMSGAITTDMGLTARSMGFVGKELKGKVGNGEAQIKLSSVSGKLSVNRRSDGQKPSAAEDLVSESRPVTRLGQRYNEALKNSQSLMAVRQAEELAKLNEKFADISKNQLKITEQTKAISLAQAKELSQLNINNIELAQNALELSRSAEGLSKINEKFRENAAGLQALSLNQFRTAWWGSGVPSVETRNKSFKVDKAPKIKIDGDGTDLVIRGWDKNEVKYSITEVSENRNRVPVDVFESADNSNLELKFTDVNDPPRNGYVAPRSNSMIEIMVPSDASIVIKTNRDIRIHNVKGKVKLEGKENSINIRELDGELALNITDSHIRVLGFNGKLENNSENSEIFLEGSFNSLDSQGNNNRVIVTLPENAAYRVRSNNPFEADGIDARSEGENVWSIGSGKLSSINFNHENTAISLRSIKALRANSVFN